MASTIRTLACALGLFAGLAAAPAALAAGGGNLLHSGADVGDQASLQRGAKYFMSYCSGCHSLTYLRYARLGDDLGLSEKEVMDNLVMMPGAKIGDPIGTAMTPAMGLALFRKAPPDLSLISRVRGDDWIFTYLKSFYLDESRPLGWNNTLFPNASMPNPLWELQGLQHASYTAKVQTGTDHDGKPVMGCAAGTVEADGRCIQRLVVPTPGKLDTAQFDQVARDITAFLSYAGEPARMKRQGIGVWVLLFLAIFTLLAWLLKNEYWRDVH